LIDSLVELNSTRRYDIRPTVSGFIMRSARVFQRTEKSDSMTQRTSVSENLVLNQILWFREINLKKFKTF